MSDESTITATVDRLAVLGDGTRIRLLNLLDGEELSVAELVGITGLGQSRISTHIGRLATAELLVARKSGQSTYYTRKTPFGTPTEELWRTLRSQLSDDQLAEDLRRRTRQLATRSNGHELRWPESVAGQMERHYAPGRSWEATAYGFLGLTRLGRVLDVGAGDGVVASVLAASAETVTCLDHSKRMLQAARERLTRQRNVEFVVGDMHDLPFPSESFDHVMHFHALTYAREPKAALADALRVLRPGGRLSLLTLKLHPHRQIAREFGHLNDGQDPDELRSQALELGFLVHDCRVRARERRPPNFELLAASLQKPPQKADQSSTRGL